MAARTFVPFEDLWSMAIDVPYSFLVRDGDHAWTCGQLALGTDAEVLSPNDLTEQSEIVCRNIGDILAKGGMSTADAARIILYYLPEARGGLEGMMRVFRDYFGPDALLDPFPVPHFYYDGVALEVDVFAHAARKGSFCGDLHHQSRSFELMDLAATLDELETANTPLLSEHWLTPTPFLEDVAASLRETRRSVHPGTVIDIGPSGDQIFLRTVAAMSDTPGQTDEALQADGVEITLRKASEWLWIQGSAERTSDGLVDQTTRIMQAIAARLAENGFCFDDVVKSTTHYVAGDSAAELHDNMQVRNSRYSKPGPASTGVPVFGFADPSKKIVVDLTAKKTDA